LKTNFFSYSSKINLPPNEVYNWHESREAINQLMPKNLIDILKYSSIAEGNELHFKIKVFFGIFKLNWVAKIEKVIRGKEFSDIQIKGPFKYWRHRHIFKRLENEKKCLMKDQIEFVLFGGSIINFLLKPIVIKNLKSTFQTRHSKLREAIEKN
tara:strand:+ start:117 stop:578 length:462 start_codon:yes stop_codon:yes gene_type:complete